MIYLIQTIQLVHMCTDHDLLLYVYSEFYALYDVARKPSMNIVSHTSSGKTSSIYLILTIQVAYMCTDHDLLYVYGKLCAIYDVARKPSADIVSHNTLRKNVLYITNSTGDF